jgi:teichuronic acid biosynthesis glycosyltransferase TuaC
MARSIPLSPTATSRGLHWTDSVGLAKGHGYMSEAAQRCKPISRFGPVSLRIAVITSSYPRGPDDAAGHFVRSEVALLGRTGAQVTVVAPGAGPAEPGLCWVQDHGAFGWPGALERLRAHPLRALGVLRFCWAARRALLDAGPFDRLVAHWIVPSGWPVGAGVPGELEVVAHGSDVKLLLGLPPSVRREIVGRLIDRGAAFRFVSSALRRELAQATFPELEGLASVAPCAVDVSEAPDRARARQKLGLDPEEPWIVVVGRLLPAKRVDVALRAATLVPRAQVAVVGDGPERARLERDHGYVKFLGHLSRSHTLAWIAAADLLLTASEDEGAPTVVREARAIGTPVVAKASGDLVDWASRDPDLVVVR